MASDARQATFAGGEIAPELYGRSDLPRHQAGAKTVSNFIITAHGAAMSRPGFGYMGEVYDSATETRLVPFILDGASSYMLEFGDQRIRVWQNGALATYPTEAGAAYDGGTNYAFGDYVTSGGLHYISIDQRTCGNEGNLVTNTAYWQEFTLGAVYSLDTSALGGIPAGALPRMRFAQSGDTLTICCSGYTAKDLLAYAPYALMLRDAVQLPSYYVTKPSAVTAVHVDPNGDLPNPDWPANSWGYSVTAVDAAGRESDGFIIADADLVIGPVASIPGGGDPPVHTDVDYRITVTPTDAVTPTSAAAVAFRIYRGRSGLYGYVGECDVGDTFSDVGDEPDYVRQPPAQPNSYPVGPNAAGAVCYFENRKVFAAGTDWQNEGMDDASIWASWTGNYNRFDTYSLQPNTGACRFRLASRTREKLVSLVPLSAILALSESTEWSVKGASDAPLSSASIQARAHGSRGSGTVDALPIGNTVLHTNDRGAKIRDMRYDVNQDSYVGNDLSIWAQHLLSGYYIVSWAFQAIPHSVVWCVRDDGLLLGLTYDREHEVVAWHQHSTDGIFENVCVVPEDGEDAVYVVVRRTIGGVDKRYVEKLQPRVVFDPVAVADGLADDVRLYNGLDSSLQFDGRNTEATTMTVTSATTYAGGEEVTVTASAASFAATDVGDCVVIGSYSEEDARVTVTGYTSATEVTGTLDGPLSADYQGLATTDWGWARDTMSGLDHLEGETVSFLADGETVGTAEVVGGEVTLERPAMLCSMGLPYVCDLVPTDLPSKLQVKSVDRVLVEVSRSRGLWAGPDADSLLEQRAREVSDSYDTVGIYTGAIELRVKTSFNKTGTVLLRQVSPLPLTIVALTREVTVGGR